MTAPENAFVNLDDLVARERQSLGYERVQVLEGHSFKDASTVMVVPTRDKSVRLEVSQAWENLAPPMNGKRVKLYAVGDEVGTAYNRMIQNILSNPVLSQWKYVLTMEDDNIPLPDGHLKLLESIDIGPFDAVSGIYFTKGYVNEPMAYGNPREFIETGEIDFRPRDIVAAMKTGTIVEVNGIGMGFALWRMDLFRDVPPPWFVTTQGIFPNEGMKNYSQDLFFCKRARLSGKRFAVDLRVPVGHIDKETGVVY
jgi:hypothetical protein